MQTSKSTSPFLQRVRSAIRVRHYSIRTEQAYVDWIRRFILFHGKRHPKELGEAEVGRFLTWLAVERNVAPSTQNQALNALVFLYRHVIDRPLGDITNAARAKKPQKLPVVLTQDETKRLFRHLDGNQWRSVFRQLVARGYFSVDLEVGSLRLAEKCRPLLKGEESIDLRKEVKQSRAKKQTRTPLPEDIDVGLWEALRDCRRRLAEEQGVPPYVIFHDRTLQEMCAVQPTTEEQFGQLTGVGERKREKYAEIFLAVIAERR